MKKKFLALVMTLSMVLSLVPMTALAAGDDQVEKEATVAAENQATSEGAGNQDSNFNADSGNTPTGGEGSTDTSDTNTNNGNTGSEPGSTGGTESGGSSTSGTEGSGNTPSSGGTEGGSTTETAEPETPTEPATPKNAAQIGDTPYRTLDEAIEAATESDTIELLKNCELTVKTIDHAIKVNGNGKTISIPKQETEKGGLQINASATFLNTKLAICNPDETSDQESAWSIIMNGNGVFTLDQGSECTITTRGIYTSPNATINVIGGSKLNLQETTYTAMMAEAYANLNIRDRSAVHIDRAYHGNGVPNGITSFKIAVTDSEFTVTNCDNQGLVSCWLTLDNSEAEISGNDIGITGWNGTDVLTMKNSSTLTMENNKNAGIFIWGGKVDIQNGNTLTITGTGSANTGAVTPAYYNGAVAVYTKTGNTANVSFADGATVILKNNGLSAINNLSTTSSSFYVGSGTEITCNGDKTNYGGGIYNFGSITIADGAKVYNNHAAIAGDDIYNSSIKKKGTIYTGSILFGKTGEDWKLDDCKPEHPILGWYKDGMESNKEQVLKRWNVHGEGEDYYAEEYTAPTTEVTEALALKAAHPLLYKVSYDMSGEIPGQYKNKEPEQKFYAANSKYTIADTFPSVPGVNDNGANGTFSFSGWSFTQGGTPVSGEKTLTEDVTLYGVWTFTKKSSSHRPSNPTVTIPDDVPTGLDLKNHYGYIIGYPVDYYTGEPTTDQTKKPVRPEGKITRAEVATIYFRMLTDENRAANWNQVSGFSDVKSSAWYNNAISTLTKAGILKGYEDGTFQPNGYITRAEFATIAIRFFSGVYEGEDLFPDIKGHWAEDYINNAANKGLVKGYEDGTFGPDRYITRAEAVTLVNRTLNRHPHNDGLHQDMLRWPDNMDTSKWYYADMQEATNSHEPDKDKTTADKEYWGKMLPIRDWEALEKEWSNANSAPGEGEVV